jgi:hypothetical protein
VQGCDAALLDCPDRFHLGGLACWVSSPSLFLAKAHSGNKFPPQQKLLQSPFFSVHPLHSTASPPASRILSSVESLQTVVRRGCCCFSQILTFDTTWSLRDSFSLYFSDLHHKRPQSLKWRPTASPRATSRTIYCSRLQQRLPTEVSLPSQSRFLMLMPCHSRWNLLRHQI